MLRQNTPWVIILGAILPFTLTACLPTPAAPIAAASGPDFWGALADLEKPGPDHAVSGLGAATAFT